MSKDNHLIPSLSNNSKAEAKAIQDVNSKVASLLDLNVCLLCDEFVCKSEGVLISVDRLLDPSFNQYLKRSECVERRSRGEIRFEAIPEAVQQYYTYAGDEYGREVSLDEVLELKSLLVSPRGRYCIGDTVRESGFLICKSCHYGVKFSRMPKFAIANNFYFGAPPRCLLELNDVEIALLTPMRTYGYIFSYSGGKHRMLKGSLVYYKLDIEKVVKSLAHFNVPELKQNVVVLIHGTLTLDQAKRAYNRSIVRTEKLLAAVEWLTHNNAEWKDQNLAEVTRRIENQSLTAEVIERFTSIEDTNEEKYKNEEAQESFDVFYPDGTNVNSVGSTASIERFHSLMKKARSDGYTLALRKNQAVGERTSEFNNNNLVNSALLQFPYGLGGLRARRYKGDQSTGIMNVHEYVKHLINVSQPHFQSDFFCLVLYNMYVKHLMLLSACFNVRGNLSAEALVKNISANDVEAAIERRKRGEVSGGSPATVHYLNAIDSISRHIPHSNAAAKRARGTAEAHMHHYGLPTFFLTACPDDDNSIVIQIMAQNEIDTNEAIESLSDDVLESRAKQRTALRLKYPGICALYFEYALQIILEDVVGWNLKKNKKTEVNGVFGETLAVAGSIEEQGRGTLHIHLQVWVSQFMNAANDLHSCMESIANDSRTLIQSTMERLASASLFDPKKCLTYRGSYGVFEHKCSEPDVFIRRPPEVVDNDKLRELRHITGQNSSNHVFATCPHCGHSWTNKEYMESYLKHVLKRYALAAYPDTSKRLKAVAIQHQKGNITDNTALDLMPVVIDAAYNHHIHTSSCFTCKALKNKDKPTKKRTISKRKMHGEECRYRFPTCPSKHTRIRDLSETEIKWFSWNGTFQKRKVKELVLRRHRYDAFQNACCKAISHSKLSCNSNLQFVTPGPIVRYVFHYTFKSTQDDDNTKFDKVVIALLKTINRVKAEEAQPDNNISVRSMAIRLLLSGSFAHESENVTSATMAAFLIRNGSRFIFSDSVAWCPLGDIEAVLLGNKAFTTLRHVDYKPFYNNASMHYLCRPLELEHICVYDFYAGYEVVDNTIRNKEGRSETHQFVNGDYQHPSYQTDSDRMLQCVAKRKVKQLIRIQQYSFPDTASFPGNILDPATVITEDTEQYAKLVLMLFYPFRSMQSLNPMSSYTKTFRLFSQTSMFTTRAQQWLQNIQDCRGNCYRLSHIEDELQQCTECYTNPTGEVNTTCDASDDENSTSDAESIVDDALDAILNGFDQMQKNADETMTDFGSLDAIVMDTIVSYPSYSVAALRDKGKFNCGWSGLCDIALSASPTRLWVHSLNDVDLLDGHSIEHASPTINYSDRNPQKHELATLLLERVSMQHRTFASIARHLASVNVLEANGSARSIVDWGQKAKLDPIQQRAFEVFLATFILTFHVTDDQDPSSHAPSVLKEEYERLKILSGSGKRLDSQLICLLHGPGGSGKTTVIDLLMTYAKEFCDYLEHYDFDAEYTIVVTAMSGVAATLINGETTHGAIHLNRTAPFTNEHFERWEKTRLIIIDEISFASKSSIEKLNRNLNSLLRMNKLFSGHKFGGIHIIFAGDFRQLEPIRDPTLYKVRAYQFDEWINCYIELDGKHRFKDDPDFGDFCAKMRAGHATQADFDWINERVVNAHGVTYDGDKVPLNVKFCTFSNRDRDAVNAAMFSERCALHHKRDGRVDDSLIIFCDNIQAKNGSKVFQPFSHASFIHHNVGESDCEVGIFGVGRFDPALKLYIGCPIMLPFNANVSKGMANGTQGIVRNVHLKHGLVPQTVLLNGEIPISAVNASDVVAIECEHINSRVDTPIFYVAPRESTFSAKMLDPNGSPDADKIHIKMKATQVPIIVNNATTGHKLQGSTLDALYVSSWSSCVNWAYVVISRVRTKRGLFLRKPLLFQKGKFAMPPRLQKLLDSLKNKSPSVVTEAEYASFEDPYQQQH